MITLEKLLTELKAESLNEIVAGSGMIPIGSSRSGGSRSRSTRSRSTRKHNSRSRSRSGHCGCY